MILRSFVKINLLFRIMDPLKRKSPIQTSALLPYDSLLFRKNKYALSYYGSAQT